jgi:hypothetical protein
MLALVLPFILATLFACEGGTEVTDKPVSPNGIPNRNNSELTEQEASRIPAWPPIVQIMDRGKNGILISWREPNGAVGQVKAYEILRRSNSNDWRVVVVVDGSPDSTVDGHFSHLDSTAQPGTDYEYKLQPILMSP